MRARRFLPAVLGVLALCAMTMPLQAQVYKWVGPDGVERYGQVPPPGVEVKPVGGPSASAPDVQAPDATGTNAGAAADEAAVERVRAEQAEREAKRAAEIEDYCNRTRAALKALDEIPAHRLAQTSASGERARMTQEEHDAQRAQAIAGLKEHCGG